MPTNKNAMLRYRTLNQCFRDTNRNYTIDDLAVECSIRLEGQCKSGTISSRQIREDIKFMESDLGWNIELDKHGEKKIYRYKDPNFSIDNFPFTKLQCQQIQATMDALNAFEGLPQFDGLRDCFSKLELYAIKTNAKPCFGLEYNQDFVGLEYLTPLFNAIQNNTVLKIHYHDYCEEKPQTLTFHPQYLKQYNKRWFVFGCKEERPDKIRKLLLDCIEGIESATEFAYRKLDIDWNMYFEDIVGVTNSRKAPVEEVHFLVHGKTAKYIENNPIHRTQLSEWTTDDTLDVSLEVKVNKELERILLSYAPNITILEPQTLVEKHKKNLQEAIENY